MTGSVLRIVTDAGAKQVSLASYLDGEGEEQATAAALAWIKQLRHAAVDGQPLRTRFTLRGDSLWWFAEIYLHKTQAILGIFRTIAALERLAAVERPREISIGSAGRTVATVLPEFARTRGIRCTGGGGMRPGRLRIVRMDLRARALTLAAMASRLRPRRAVDAGEPGGVAAFVHRAFWRQGGDEGSAESYIGPVLSALERRLPGGVRYIGVGPAENFRARRWWHPLRGTRDARVLVPIEAFAPLGAFAGARRVWRERHALRRSLWGSAAIRGHAVIERCDCWPIVREELAGIALLQWPWSARAMDEAAAALDALRPGVVLTYAEAGGWGRALMLEARRRGIPSAGLQHGFIFRHWLNYLHEPDEMAPDARQPGDAGFPAPTLTLLFDDYAAEHLTAAGRFPREALAVTGSARLDALAAAAARLQPDDLARARTTAGAAPSQALVVVVTKYREAARALPGLLDALDRVPGVFVAIKTHPAETPDAYRPLAAGRDNVGVLPADAPLAPLVAAARAVVTVNSTVALDAAVLGIPALVIGLPNNLTPFVEAGVMAGASSADGIAGTLPRILYDDEFRLQLDRARRAFLARFAIGADGRAADRAADAVVGLLSRPNAGRPSGD